MSKLPVVINFPGGEASAVALGNNAEAVVSMDGRALFVVTVDSSFDYSGKLPTVRTTVEIREPGDRHLHGVSRRVIRRYTNQRWPEPAKTKGHS